MKYLFIIVTLLAPAGLFAQGQAIDGNIEGAVRDASGGFLGQVRVRARNLAGIPGT
jgi:hypothetical protein